MLRQLWVFIYLASLDCRIIYYLKTNMHTSHACNIVATIDLYQQWNYKVLQGPTFVIEMIYGAEKRSHFVPFHFLIPSTSHFIISYILSFHSIPATISYIRANISIEGSASFVSSDYMTFISRCRLRYNQYIYLGGELSTSK